MALIDTKENIAKITNFLNDHHQTATYVKVDGESFFTERRPDIRGWGMPPIRSDYVKKRLKRLISSGIVTHLKDMYNMWRPPKLLGYSANSTVPSVKAVSRLDFSSKVATGFYLCGCGLIISIFVLIVEIFKYKYYQMHNFVNAYN